jgi:hypothetical protein
MATILGVFLTISGVINNRTLKEEFRLTREMLDRMDRGHQEATKYVADLIRAEGEKTRQAINAPS